MSSAAAAGLECGTPPEEAVVTVPDGPLSAAPLPAAAGTVVLVLTAAHSRTSTEGLCRRLERVLAGGGVSQVVCEAGALTHPNLAAVEAVARLQLTALRSGARLRLVHTDSALRELLVLVGLSDLLPPDHALTPGNPVPPVGETGHGTAGRAAQSPG
jgi:anti-anti-sigma regulatory factor